MTPVVAGSAKRRTTMAFLAVGGLCAFLSACAKPAQPDAVAAFPEASAQLLFADGYRHVHERYIDPLPVERIAQASFDGLTSLDSGLQIRRTSDQVQLLIEGREARTFPVPSASDAEGWARVTAGVLDASWAHSPKLRGVAPERIYDSMFGSLLTQLDGYSRYTDADSADQARASREGFGGIGIVVEEEQGRPRVVRVLPDTPASRAGILAGDEITHVDGYALEGMSHHDAVEFLRGPLESEVRIRIARKDPQVVFDLVLQRAHIVPQTVTWKREGNIATFRLSSFNRHTTSDLMSMVREARQEMGRNLRGIVLDLRGNPGGLLDQAIGVADLFLTDGVIVSTRGRHPASNSAFTASRDDIARGIPMAILINGRSASAAEMVAASLQDWGRAVVIGSTTHGKGSVQNVARMPNGGELIITWSRMHAPSGYVLDRLGVLPGVCTSEAAENRGPDGKVIGEHSNTPRYAVQSDFIAWHAYDHSDDALARTLRLVCPAETDESAADETLAESLLLDQAAYRRALRPWAGLTMAQNVGESRAEVPR
ncbi:carboxyl-terminal processing protease [Constrictibacter sp. MBR-5]|uniref:S41 family peptidase n=1 Tax=Constrictibacter sp. MBR-5 TaxID=3156467 RepID=UPI00339B03F5